MLIYQDVQIGRKGIFVRSTEASIPLTWGLFRAIRRQIPFFVYILLVFGMRQLQLTRRRYKIGFYPVKPKPWYKIWAITRYLGLRVCENINDCDVLFFFEDKTHSRLETDYIGLPDKKSVNAYCTDIGKDRVSRVFEEVFGYGLDVDPTTFEGRAVRKSVENAKHDGCVIQCPIPEREPGFVYQRLIDNAYDGVHVQDLRTVVAGNCIPIVYAKERRIDERFLNDNTRAFVQEPDETFTAEEMTLILRFCRRMGLDFGGLDILRDRTTGKIYVVDVNKTCMGPPFALSLADRIRAVQRIGDALIKLIEWHRP